MKGSDEILSRGGTGVWRRVWRGGRLPTTRTARAGFAAGLLLIGLLGDVSGVTADDGSTNPLDGPLADVAVVPGADPATTPDLLALHAADAATSPARLSILRRSGIWEEASPIEIDVGGADMPDRWLADLGAGRYALIATSSRDIQGHGSSVVVIMQVSGGLTPRIETTARRTFDRTIESSGAADVDGFGSAELVLGMRPLFDPNEACGTTSVIVVDGAAAVVRRVIDLPPSIGSGVLGRFDAVPGDDLLLYLSPGCPPVGDSRTSLVSVNLRDGRQVPIGPGNFPDAPSSFPPPLRLDLDGKAPDEVLAATSAGLVVLDPASSAGQPVVGGIGSVPLLALPASNDPGGAGAGTAVRVAFLDSNGSGGLVVGDVSRDHSKLRFAPRSTLSGESFDVARWRLLALTMLATASRGDPPGAWAGDALTPGCPDLVVPGAILACGQDALRPSAAWVATRPIAAVPIDGRPTVLVASGLGWDRRLGPPRSPTPVASGPAGWWRRGPSTPFALSEMGSDELTGLEQFPTPSVTIGTAPAADGSSAWLSGLRGDRLFTSIVSLTADQDPPPTSLDIVTALTRRADGLTRVDGVIRLPVPPGLIPGRDGLSTRVDLGAVRSDGGATAQWSLEVVPLNDRGEWGAPVTSLIARDMVGPSVEVDAPLLSPIWPIAARLEGKTELGSTVTVDALGPVHVGQDGRFAITQTLAPWPQTIRVHATDTAGNASVSEFTVVGGVDYRRLPWPGIAVAILLAIVAVRGLAGDRRVREVAVERSGSSGGALDDASRPEIEELPPGGGLARG